MGHTVQTENAETAALADLVKDIGIPPRPSLLIDLQHELQRDEPRTSVMAHVVGSDVALSAALLKTANSPLMGLRRKAETVEHAFMLLGHQQCQAILTELALRKALPTNGPVLTRFWDVSTKRAHAMTHLSRSRRIGVPAVAHTFGLFVDVGIPLLIQRFKGAPNYIDTLVKANDSPEPFTVIERQVHGTDHALIGAMAARNWGVASTIALGVRLHHEYAAWEAELPVQMREMAALCLVSEAIIQRYEGLNRHVEWAKGGALAMSTLGIGELDVATWCDEMHDKFNAAG